MVCNMTMHLNLVRPTGVDITAEDGYPHVLKALDGRKVRFCFTCRKLHMSSTASGHKGRIVDCATCMAGQIGTLLVVAGYQQLDSLADVDAPGLRKHFEVNAIAPLLAVQALRNNLAEGSKVREAPFHKAQR